MAKYRRKTGIIEAEQYVEEGVPVKGMCNSTKPHVHTIHNNQMVMVVVGDWIIPEPDGKHFYPCKPDIFEQTYEPVEDGN